MEAPLEAAVPANGVVEGVPKSQASIDAATAAIGIACDTPMAIGTTVAAGTSVGSPGTVVEGDEEGDEEVASAGAGGEGDGTEDGATTDEEAYACTTTDASSRGTEEVEAGPGEEADAEAESVAPRTSGGADIDLCRTVVEVVQPESDDVCSICLDEFTDDDPGKATACSHLYHLQCIMQWAQRSRECPLCFRPLQLAEPELNELLPFGEYVAPPAPGDSRPAGGIFPRSAWELVLLQMAQAGLEGGGHRHGHSHRHHGHRHQRSGGSGGHRHHRGEDSERRQESVEERRARRERERARERRDAARGREVAAEAAHRDRRHTSGSLHAAATAPAAAPGSSSTRASGSASRAAGGSSSFDSRSASSVLRSSMVTMSSKVKGFGRATRAFFSGEPDASGQSSQRR